MDEQELRQVGERVEPGGRPKAPGRLELLQRFLNTWNHDLPADWDRLGTSERAQEWLREKGLVDGPGMVSDSDAERLRMLREAIRSLVVAHTTGEPDAVAVEKVRTAAAGAPLVVAFDDDGQTFLRGQGTGLEAAVANLIGFLHDARVGGDWVRLKGCRQCGYAFFDRSKNRSATWCSMSICGNRSKSRAHYRRHHPLPHEAP